MKEVMMDKLMKIRDLANECLDYCNEHYDEESSEKEMPKMPEGKGMEGLLLMVEGKKGKAK